MTDRSSLPLAGIRVLELGNYIAAPTAGRMLADFGAEVVKVERPGTGDELRGWRLHSGTTSMLYRTINRNKKSVALDLRSAAGLRAARQLVAASDIVLENFRPGTLEKWGLGPEVLEQLNPEVILVRISAFGQTGPLSVRPGFAAVAEAYGGFRELVGDPDRPPSRVGVSIGDSIAGMQAAFGACMLLFDRERSRTAAAGSGAAAGSNLDPRSGRTVDVALHEAMFSVMESLIPDYSAFGVRRTRTGGRTQGIAPSNAYPCLGGKSIVIAGNGDGIFRRYMAVIGRSDLAADPGLQTNQQRWERRDELDEAISAWTRRRSPEEALAALEAAEVPAGPIYTAEDILADEQYRARNMLQHFDVDTGAEVVREVAFPGITPVLDGRSVDIDHLGPDLGEHTVEVLQGAGVDADTIAEVMAGTRTTEEKR
ncbi:CoA transferase [Brevibacterium daeguense]|uniref:CoA transferase n=1 Tax=Brevibacterium daeguense TaxID=909936 RepID=A0ABP8ELX5_9MICO|nr:CaiB/BaiF CoA-transferase family protein [Brevibacterium daeguense]